jgi:hypothetical protein
VHGKQPVYPAAGRAYVEPFHIKEDVAHRFSRAQKIAHLSQSTPRIFIWKAKNCENGDFLALQIGNYAGYLALSGD